MKGISLWIPLRLYQLTSQLLYQESLCDVMVFAPGLLVVSDVQASLNNGLIFKLVKVKVHFVNLKK